MLTRLKFGFWSKVGALKVFKINVPRFTIVVDDVWMDGRPSDVQ